MDLAQPLPPLFSSSNHSPVFKRPHHFKLSVLRASRAKVSAFLPTWKASALIFRKLCLERHSLSTEAGSLTLSFALSTLNNKDSRVLLQSLKNQPSLGPLHNSLLVFFTLKKRFHRQESNNNRKSWKAAVHQSELQSRESPGATRLWQRKLLQLKKISVWKAILPLLSYPLLSLQCAK